MGFWDKVKDAVAGEDVPKDTNQPAPAEAAPQAPADSPATGASNDTDGGMFDHLKDVVAGDDQPTAPAEPEAAEAQAAPPPRHKEAKPQHRTYTVKSGDTLSEIGQEFGVDYMDIARLNDIKNPDLIYPGQVFKIPNK